MKTYGVPMALWVAAGFGLVLMLERDGFYDLVGLVLTTTPLLVLGAYAWRAYRSARV